MITCLYEGHLPAIVCPGATLPTMHKPSLTEIVSLAVYGAPLKPGKGQGTLREQLGPLQIEGRALWRDDNGPGWLRSHLELIAVGKSWPFAPDTRDDNERITLGWFAKSQKWLSEWRKIPVREGLPPEITAKAERLAAMSDAEAIEFALAEAERIDCAERVVNARAVQFYKTLSQFVVRDLVNLKAIPVNPDTGIRLQQEPGQPLHTTMHRDHFNCPLVHNLYDNELEVNRFGSEAEVLEQLFNRTARANDATLVKWVDVSVSFDDARKLLSRTLIERVGIIENTTEEAEAEASRLGVGPVNPQPDPAVFDPMKEVRWTFPMALAWIVWRDPDKVRQESDKWRAQARDWRVLHSLALQPDGTTRSTETVDVGPLSRQHGSYLATVLDVDVRGSRGQAPRVLPYDAKAALWQVLQEGKLDPDRIDDASGRPIPIPAREFRVLDICHAIDGEDYLSGGLAGPNYSRPSLSRAAVVDEWPLEPAEACTASEGQAPSVSLGTPTKLADRSHKGIDASRTGRSGMPGPESDCKYIEEFAKCAFPTEGKRPSGMSKSEYRQKIREAMGAAKQEGQNRRIPSDDTFKKHGF